MFASFVVTLRPKEQAQIGNAPGKSLHGLFFRMLEEQDRAFAQSVHADSQFKRFTVSPLRGRFEHAPDNRRVVKPDQSYWVRYTVLSDDLFNRLSQILLGKFLYRAEVVIDGAPFCVQDVTVEPGKSRGWGAISSAEEIWERARAVPDLTLRFASPTTFRQNELNLQFPIPKNVFYSYREKWNAFAAPVIDDGLVPWVEQHLAVEAHELQTRMVWFGDFQLHGFVGWCRYAAQDRDPLRLKQINALADFALFCGTGQKPTQGMGQTRRLPDRNGPPAHEESEAED